MKRRPAYSLVELLIAMTMLALIVATTGVLLHSMHRLHHATDQYHASQRAWYRLGDRLRRDAHAARSVRQDEARPDRLFLVTAENDEIELRASGDAIERYVRSGERIVHQDRFPVPAGGACQWQVDRTDQATFVILRFLQQANAPQAGDVVTTQRIVANVGWDHRFRRTDHVPHE